MHNRSIAELAAGLRAGEFSSVELTRAMLDRIASLDSRLNSVITRTEASALEQARAADRRLGAGEARPLTGIPFLHKDIFCTLGVRTSCGSRMLDNFEAP
ncbi:MAG: amidase family protein, partial [Gammaproteobacteria bacterium]